MLVRGKMYICHPVKDYECNIMKDLLASREREFLRTLVRGSYHRIGSPEELPGGISLDEWGV